LEGYSLNFVVLAVLIVQAGTSMNPQHFEAVLTLRGNCSIVTTELTWPLCFSLAPERMHRQDLC